VASHAPYDLLAKLLLSEICEGKGTFGIEHELSVNPRRADFWYQHDGRSTIPGIFGRMLGRGCSMVECYQHPPSMAVWRQCIQKQVALQSKLKADYPWLYVISAGRPTTLIRQGRLLPLEGWPRGFYEGAPLYQARLIVVSELPKRPETLLLRLLGTGPTLEAAGDELTRLPEASWERETASAVLPAFRLSMSDVQESTMIQPYQDMYEKWVREQRAIGEQIGIEKGIEKGIAKGIEKGIEKGLEEAARKSREATVATLVELYRVRFSTPPDELVGLLHQVKQEQQLQALVVPFATRSQEEVGALLRGLATH
jgi:hypothetical protein